MILFSQRYGREIEAVLVPEPTPYLLVENERVYEAGDVGLSQFTIVEADDSELAALEEAGFQFGAPKGCSARGKPSPPSLLPLDPHTDHDPF